MAGISHVFITRQGGLASSYPGTGTQNAVPPPESRRGSSFELPRHAIDGQPIGAARRTGDQYFKKIGNNSSSMSADSFSVLLTVISPETYVARKLPGLRSIRSPSCACNMTLPGP
jgi:hypothetical protein